MKTRYSKRLIRLRILEQELNNNEIQNILNVTADVLSGYYFNEQYYKDLLILLTDDNIEIKNQCWINFCKETKNVIIYDFSNDNVLLEININNLKWYLVKHEVLIDDTYIKDWSKQNEKK